MFVWYVFFALLSVFFSIKLGILENKYNVFKSKGFFALSIILFYVLMIGMMVSAVFTAKVNIDEGKFFVSANPIFYFLCYLPLYFGYIIFVYYAFMRCFAKFQKK